MNIKHLRTLWAIDVRPVSANIRWRTIASIRDSLELQGVNP